MDLDYLKEMPKPETKMRMDLTPLLDPLFFTWVVQLLLPVSLFGYHHLHPLHKDKLNLYISLPTIHSLPGNSYTSCLREGT